MEQKTYTFLFTDIEGSTRLWEQYPEAMSLALSSHNQIVSEAVIAHRGRIFSTAGDGFCAVFASAPDALAASLAVFRGMHQAQEAYRLPIRLRLRLGLHTGPAEERQGEYFGINLSRVARLTAAANGGQILLSEPTRMLLPDSLPDRIELRDLGRHYLRDIREPEHLYQVILPDLPVSFVPVRTLTSRPTNLPASLTTFVGREPETQEIARRLRRRSARLLTLTGPGGIGKTRLSLQAGRDVYDDFHDGVFFVDLAPLQNASAVVEAIAGVLKVEESPSTALVDVLKNHLYERHLLLILDNFEHIIEAAPVINQLLANSPRLSVLVTSREPLRIYGEQVFPVLPLDIPAAGNAPDVEVMLQSASIGLFVQRVQAVQHDFALTETSAPQVLEICRHLDGLPLALELAAARANDIPLPEMVTQLSTRLTLLTRGPRDVSSRHQTIRNTLDWSYDLLTLPEQQAFAALAIFAGQFTVEAAGQIFGEMPLADLTRRSLLQAVPGTGETLMMLETVREYARERLAQQGTLAEVQQKHASYYCTLVETAEPHLTGAAQIEWIQRLDTAWHNLSAALEWAAAAADWQLTGRMVAVLWRYWSNHSRLSEGSRWLARTLDAGTALPALLRARILQGAGRLALLRHDYAAALSLLQQGLALFETEKQIHGQATSLLFLGETAFQQGDTARAEHYFLDSLALHREMDEYAGIARCLDNLGRLATREGNFAAAEPLLEESLILARKHGSIEGLALVLNNLAETRRAQEKYAEAAELYRESLDIYRRLDIQIGVAVMLHNLAQVELPQGNRITARDLFIEALELLKELDDRQIIAECLAGLGGVFLRTGEPERAVRFLAAAKGLLDTLDARMDYADQAAYDRHLAETHARLDDTAWNAAWREGQLAAVEQIIAEALRSFGNKRRTSTSEFGKVNPKS